MRAHSVTLCLELISCFVPEGPPLSIIHYNHTVPPQRAREGTRANEQGSVKERERNKRGAVKDLEGKRERIIIQYFCMSVFQSLQSKSLKTVFVVEWLNVLCIYSRFAGLIITGSYSYANCYICNSQGKQRDLLNWNEYAYQGNQCLFE